MRIRSWLHLLLAFPILPVASAQEAKIPFIPGGPYGLDKRIHDLSAAVDYERSYLVEVLKGQWQGPFGPEQGTLLFVATDSSRDPTVRGAHFWVLQPDVEDMEHPSARPLARMNLPDRIVRIVPEAGRTLVGVEANGKGCVLDLKNLVGNCSSLVSLTPIYPFDVQGAWTLSDGLLCGVQPVRPGTRPSGSVWLLRLWARTQRGTPSRA